MPRTNKKRPVIDRFSEKFSIHNSGCWIWQAGKDKNGYGKIWDNDLQRTVCAHRFSYRIFVGEIPRGAKVILMCGNNFCVNPNHFRLRRYGEKENKLIVC